MKGYLKRGDDFETRRSHLKNLTDEELKNKFWELAEKIVDPKNSCSEPSKSPCEHQNRN